MRVEARIGAAVAGHLWRVERDRLVEVVVRERDGVGRRGGQRLRRAPRLAGGDAPVDIPDDHPQHTKVGGAHRELDVEDHTEARARIAGPGLALDDVGTDVSDARIVEPPRVVQSQERRIWDEARVFVHGATAGPFAVWLPESAVEHAASRHEPRLLSIDAQHPGIGCCPFQRPLEYLPVRLVLLVAKVQGGAVRKDLRHGIPCPGQYLLRAGVGTQCGRLRRGRLNPTRGEQESEYAQRKRASGS